MSASNLPANWPVASDWIPLFETFFSSRDGIELLNFVRQSRKQGSVFPRTEDVFNAFSLTRYCETKVVILGQDPYHGVGQAHGLSFSVRDGTKLPPSLRNIFKELDGPAPPVSGNLESWARQGVLLLNTVLTVDEGKPGSHRGKGWEKFTDLVISKLNTHPNPIVFVLWGKPAGQKADLIDARHKRVIAPHPSPLSAHRGFTGSRPFSEVNDALRVFQRTEIDWVSVYKSTSNLLEVGKNCSISSREFF